MSCFLCSGSYHKSLHGKVVLQCIVHQSCLCKCVFQREMAFSSMAQFHLNAPILEWKYRANGWKMSPPLLYKKEPAYMKNISFLAITEQRSALQCSIIYLHFLCPVGIASNSAFPHTLFWEDKPSVTAFLAREVITVKVEDHSYSNFWTNMFPLSRNQTTNIFIKITVSIL